MSASTKIIQAAAGVETGGPAGNAWDVSTAQWLAEDANFLSVGFRDQKADDIFFRSDGAKMYVIGDRSENINEYNVSTPWDVSTAFFLQSFNVESQDPVPIGIFFKPDGTKMYMLGNANTSVFEYDLSTAWDISTASFLQSFDVSSEETSPIGIFFKPDGLKMYIVGRNSESVNEYDLSTAWDISSASFLQLFSVSSQDNKPNNVFFKPDGTRMYVSGGNDDDVNEYDLSTAWDISSASFSQNFSVASQAGGPRGIFFKPDGSVMHIIDANSDAVYQYQLSTAWDISSASYQEPTTRYFDGSAIDPNIADIFFKPDGAKMYLLGGTVEKIDEFDVSNPWDVSSASFLQTLSLSAQDDLPSGLFFKPDGTRMYVTGGDGEDVNEYDLSTAWDISSASFSRAKSVSAQETTPRSVFFKPDGTRMYVVGTSSVAVHEYAVNPAWAVTAASFSQTFSVSAQESSPRDVHFKPDGLKMYIVGIGGGEVNEYDLSTAWDISSSTFLHNFDASNQGSLPAGIFFKPDGLKMYMTEAFTDSVYEYDL